MAKTTNKYITQESGEVKVDWEALLRDQKEYRMVASERAITEGPLEESIQDLLDLGVLSFSRKGTFWITDGWGTSLTPSDDPAIILTFTREQDAVAYADIKYKGTLHPVKISEVY